MFKNLNSSEVKKLLSSKKVVLLDVREKAEFEFGHLKGSVNLPLSEFFETPQNADVLPKDKDLVVFCRAGGRSLHASRVLLEKGFNVFNLEGGLLALNQELPAQKKIKIKEH